MVHIWIDKFDRFLFLNYQTWLINPFLDLDIKNEETGMMDKDLVSFQNDIELKPKFKKLYRGFWLQKTFLTCTVEKVLSRAGFQCRHPACLQAKKQTENY